MLEKLAGDMRLAYLTLAVARRQGALHKQAAAAPAAGGAANWWNDTYNQLAGQWRGLTPTQQQAMLSGLGAAGLGGLGWLISGKLRWGLPLALAGGAAGWFGPQAWKAWQARKPAQADAWSFGPPKPAGSQLPADESSASVGGTGRSSLTRASNSTR